MWRIAGHGPYVPLLAPQKVEDPGPTCTTLKTEVFCDILTSETDQKKFAKSVITACQMFCDVFSLPLLGFTVVHFRLKR